MSVSKIVIYNPNSKIPVDIQLTSTENDVNKEKYNLFEMLSRINEENIHKEIETGDPVGKEVWNKPL